ncbi:2OG-Fe(II) oxygenase family protein [Pseudonocardia phyllosphaerae]|uniref:2OG-Fe(II) oxygenase family protein n=1 Tax=Pseudonocardia phyllosphaerae TaxID=3390502 RepID=UPI00397B1FA6
MSDLMGSEYRKAIADYLQQPIAEALEIRLVRHKVGDWISPHTDRADKLFSHILYFNPTWQVEWGGCLQILRSSDPDSAVATVIPNLGASVLLARSPESWHQVTAVRGDAPVRERSSLLVHGLR